MDHIAEDDRVSFCWPIEMRAAIEAAFEKGSYDGPCFLREWGCQVHDIYEELQPAADACMDLFLEKVHRAVKEMFGSIHWAFLLEDALRNPRRFTWTVLVMMSGRPSPASVKPANLKKPAFLN